MKRPIEPGLLRIFRYFTSIAMAYFAILWAYAILSAGLEWSLQLQLWINFAVFLGLAVYLSWSELEVRLKHFYLPIGLAMSTLFPVFNNFVYLIAPYPTHIDIIITRSWLWLPVLLVPLVLIAWQYDLKAVIGFTIFTNGLELIVLLAVVDQITYETFAVLGVPLVRAFAFGIVGYVVGNLMETQRRQQEKLIEANLRLGRYAGTLDQLATSRERNRLAGELHDTLAHTLSGLAINLEAVKTILNPAEQEAHQMLEHSLQTTRVGLDETRRALKALRARPLEDMGLVLALEQVCRLAAERAAIPIPFSCPTAMGTLPHDVEQCLYRITQEALENIVRHAQATQAGVTLINTGAGVELTIRDNGVGFDLDDRKPDDHFGLSLLQERARSTGGRLGIESRTGGGTQIKFTWEQFK
ncbi:MAG TPA: sensor histidine kinase [Anaerolineaceae bacterium]|nr:sensor histidine kinase [Anaerolineaceae bacterium]